MVQNIIRHIILFTLLFGVMSCENFADDYAQAEVSGESKVYMVVTRSAHILGEESINEDASDFEDRVHDLALFVFDSASGILVGEPYFESNIPITQNSKAFVVQLTPGQRDFYFVGNMPKAQMQTITTRSALEAYMKQTLDLDVNLYLSASTSKGFPMSRVYRNQTITQIGTIYNPAPFKPVDGNEVEDKVKLRRAVAQLQVDIVGVEIGTVKNVYYKNAFRKFSLLPLNSPMISPGYYVEANGNPMRKSGNSYIYYMPEALMTTTTAWKGATDHKPINYFVIETVSGTKYEIPIITYEEPIPGGNYLSFARGVQSEKPDYNIYRNRRYVYTIKGLEDIEINYEIDPWTLVQSSFYMGYGYNVGVDDEGNVTISNTVLACTPHAVKLVTRAGFAFEGGGNTKTFADTDPAATVTYKVLPVSTGAYLDVYYNDVLVKTFTR